MHGFEPRRFAAISLSIIVFATNCAFAHLPQTNIWNERKTQGNRNSLETQLAFLPVAGSLDTRFSPGAVNVSTVKKLETWVGRFDSQRAKSPSQYGRLKLVSLPSSDTIPRTVLHVHDIHQNEEAQRHIAAMIAGLLHRGEADLIAVEGSAGEIPTRPFQRHPGKDAVRAVADYLLSLGKISGAVYAAMTAQPSDVPIVGVEDSIRYRANIDATRASAAVRPAVKRGLNRFSEVVKSHLRQNVNPKLAAFDSAVTAYHRGEQSMGEYVRLLTIDRDDIPTEIMIFLEAWRMESTIDQEKIESERKDLLNRLVPRLTIDELKILSDRGSAMRLGEATPLGFYRELESAAGRHKISLRSYPHLIDYLQYLALSEALDIERISIALEQFEEDGYARRAVTTEEKRLSDLSRFHVLAEKLIDFSLTRSEWARYAKLRRKMFSPGAATDRPADVETDYKRFVISNFSPFETFYLEALRRDEAMASRLLEEMDRRKSRRAVLVTGGFHAAGICDRLRRRGIGMTQFSPKITKVETLSGTEYLSAFAREKNSLERLFEGEKLFLAQPAAAGLPLGRALIVSAEEGREPQSSLREPQALFRTLGESKKRIVLSRDRPTGSEIVVEDPALGRFSLFAGVRVERSSGEARVLRISGLHLQPQSWVGSWGGRWVFGVIAPFFEEYFRFVTTIPFGFSNSLWPVVLYSVVHAGMHVFVDVKEGGWNVFARRLPWRVALSAGFGSVLWAFAGVTGPDTGPVVGFFAAVAVHAVYNVAVVSIVSRVSGGKIRLPVMSIEGGPRDTKSHPSETELLESLENELSDTVETFTIEPSADMRSADDLLTAELSEERLRSVGTPWTIAVSMIPEAWKMDQDLRNKGFDSFQRETEIREKLASADIVDVFSAGGFSIPVLGVRLASGDVYHISWISQSDRSKLALQPSYELNMIRDPQTFKTAIAAKPFIAWGVPWYDYVSRENAEEWIFLLDDMPSLREGLLTVGAGQERFRQTEEMRKGIEHYRRGMTTDNVEEALSLFKGVVANEVLKKRAPALVESAQKRVERCQQVLQTLRDQQKRRNREEKRKERKELLAQQEQAEDEESEEKEFMVPKDPEKRRARIFKWIGRYLDPRIGALEDMSHYRTMVGVPRSGMVRYLLNWMKPDRDFHETVLSAWDAVHKLRNERANFFMRRMRSFSKGRVVPKSLRKRYEVDNEERVFLASDEHSRVDFLTVPIMIYLYMAWNGFQRPSGFNERQFARDLFEKMREEILVEEALRQPAKHGRLMGLLREEVVRSLLLPEVFLGLAFSEVGRLSGPDRQNEFSPWPVCLLLSNGFEPVMDEERLRSELEDQIDRVVVETPANEEGVPIYRVYLKGVYQNIDGKSQRSMVFFRLSEALPSFDVHLPLGAEEVRRRVVVDPALLEHHASPETLLNLLSERKLLWAGDYAVRTADGTNILTTRLFPEDERVRSWFQAHLSLSMVPVGFREKENIHFAKLKPASVSSTGEATEQMDTVVVPETPLLSEEVLADMRSRVLDKTILVIGPTREFVRADLAPAFERFREKFPDVRFIAAFDSSDDRDRASGEDVEGSLPIVFETTMSDMRLVEGRGFKIRGSNEVHDVDGVIIAPPASARWTTAQQWVERGVPVWIENPSESDVKKLPTDQADLLFAYDAPMMSSSFLWALYNDELWDMLGKIHRIDAKGVDERGPSLSGNEPGKMFRAASEIGTHALAMMEVVLGNHNLSLADAVVEEIIVGRHREAAPAVETFEAVRGNIGGIEIRFVTEAGAKRTFHGVSLHGEGGRVDIMPGWLGVDPYVEVRPRDGLSTRYVFENGDRGVARTMSEFLLRLYESKSVNGLELDLRRNAIRGISAFLRQVRSRASQLGKPLVYDNARPPSPPFDVTVGVPDSLSSSKNGGTLGVSFLFGRWYRIVLKNEKYRAILKDRIRRLKIRLADPTATDPYVADPNSEGRVSLDRKWWKFGQWSMIHMIQAAAFLEEMLLRASVQFGLLPYLLQFLDLPPYAFVVLYAVLFSTIFHLKIFVGGEERPRTGWLLPQRAQLFGLAATLGTIVWFLNFPTIAELALIGFLHSEYNLIARYRSLAVGNLSLWARVLSEPRSSTEASALNKIAGEPVLLDIARLGRARRYNPRDLTRREIRRLANQLRHRQRPARSRAGFIPWREIIGQAESITHRLNGNAPVAGLVAENTFGLVVGRKDRRLVERIFARFEKVSTPVSLLLWVDQREETQWKTIIDHLGARFPSVSVRIIVHANLWDSPRRLNPIQFENAVRSLPTRERENLVLMLHQDLWTDIASMAAEKTSVLGSMAYVRLEEILSGRADISFFRINAILTLAKRALSDA